MEACGALSSVLCCYTENGDSEFSSYEIELRIRVTQNDVTLTNSKISKEILFSSY